jgi:hypothetical protein
MAFKNLRQRLSSSVAELDQARLQDRYAGLDLTPICDAPARQPIRIGGEVRASRVVPRAGAMALEVTIGDGKGEAVAVFTGRRAIRGLAPGRGVLLEGVGRADDRGLVLLNPAYTLLP